MLPLFLGILMVVKLGPIGAAMPAREPQMAANGSTVAVTFGAGTGIYFSASADRGRTFSAPVKVAQAAVVPLSHHRGPRIAVLGKTIVITAVVGRTVAQGPHAHGLPSDGDLIAWRSIDGGTTWSEGVVLNDVPSASTEGLHSLASDGKRVLFAAWLDKRSGRGTTLYGAHSADGGLTWSKNVLIYQSPDGTICECCHPSVAIDSGGQVLVMWRNWLAGARDMYLTRSQDQVNFSKPEKLGTGTWKLNACPLDGGGLAISQNRIVAAWRREHEIFLASPGKPEVAVAQGADVAIAGDEKGLYAIWSTPAGLRSLIPGQKEPLAIAPGGSFPNIVTLPNGHALAAWEDDGKIVIERIR